MNEKISPSFLSVHVTKLELRFYDLRHALRWFKSCFSKIKLFVSINGHYSSLSTLSAGVPQRSVLGSLLFLLYINDLPNSSQLLTFFLFADYTNIYCESENFQLLTRKVKREIKKVELGLDSNKLALNVERKNLVIFPPPPRKHFILRSKYVKFPWVLIAEQLSTLKNFLKILVSSSK